MTTAWDFIAAHYEGIIGGMTTLMPRDPDRIHDQGQYQYYIDHAKGMLQIIPLLPMDPLVANFQPFPYISHDTLTFYAPASTRRVEVWFNVEDQTSGIRLRNGDTVLQTTTVIGNIFATLQQFLEYLLQ